MRSCAQNFDVIIVSRVSRDAIAFVAIAFAIDFGIAFAADTATHTAHHQTCGRARYAMHVRHETPSKLLAI